MGNRICTYVVYSMGCKKWPRPLRNRLVEDANRISQDFSPNYAATERKFTRARIVRTSGRILASHFGVINPTRVDILIYFLHCFLPVKRLYSHLSILFGLDKANLRLKD